MVGMTRCLIRTTRRKQLSFVDHLVRKSGVEKLVMEGESLLWVGGDRIEKVARQTKTGISRGHGVGCWMRCDDMLRQAVKCITYKFTIGISK